MVIIVMNTDEYNTLLMQMKNINGKLLAVWIFVRDKIMWCTNSNWMQMAEDCISLTWNLTERGFQW